MKKFLFLLINALIISIPARAQEVEMATTFRSEGKIYVVVAVLGIILTGIIVYLINLDRKISKLEKSKENKYFMKLK